MLGKRSQAVQDVAGGNVVVNLDGSRAFKWQTCLVQIEALSSRRTQAVAVHVHVSAVRRVVKAALSKGSPHLHCQRYRDHGLGYWLHDTTQSKITRIMEEDEDKVAAAPSRE
jgi:hypothetical protein